MCHFLVCNIVISDHTSKMVDFRTKTTFCIHCLERRQCPGSPDGGECKFINGNMPDHFATIFLPHARKILLKMEKFAKTYNKELKDVFDCNDIPGEWFTPYESYPPESMIVHPNSRPKNKERRIQNYRSNASPSWRRQPSSRIDQIKNDEVGEQIEGATSAPITKSPTPDSGSGSNRSSRDASPTPPQLYDFKALYEHSSRVPPMINGQPAEQKNKPVAQRPSNNQPSHPVDRMPMLETNGTTPRPTPPALYSSQPGMQSNSVACRHWIQGHCYFGEKCHFRHTKS